MTESISLLVSCDLLRWHPSANDAFVIKLFVSYKFSRPAIYISFKGTIAILPSQAVTGSILSALTKMTSFAT